MTGQREKWSRDAVLQSAWGHGAGDLRVRFYFRGLLCSRERPPTSFPVNLCASPPPTQRLRDGSCLPLQMGFGQHITASAQHIPARPPPDVIFLLFKILHWLPPVNFSIKSPYCPRPSALVVSSLSHLRITYFPQLSKICNLHLLIQSSFLSPDTSWLLCTHYLIYLA